MSARDFALFQLDQLMLPGFKPRVIRRRVAPPVDPRDLALAEQIYVGAVKHLMLLSSLVEHHSGQRQKNIDPVVRKILVIALYQLRFLRVPAHAAVDEAVEQTRRFGRPGAAGFVNAVLRNATRKADPTDLPIDVALSHPRELLDRLERLLGAERAAALCRKHNDPPPTIVRLAKGATAEGLVADGVTAKRHATAGMFVVDGARQALLADWARRGIAQVQDPTAAAVVLHCDVRPGQTLLDRCCGMGTKTIQLWECSQPGGRVFAMDANARRCAALRQLLADRAISDIGVIEASWLKDAAAVLPKAFDRILVDAPCSNSGVLSRRAEARYAQDAETLSSLAELQARILDDTAPFVAAGGLLVYSTCSIWPEENEAVVSAFVERCRQFERERVLTTLPSVDPDATTHCDGGFVAVLRRRG